MKNNSGITLIALIITIVVLLILAGISIAAISGNDSMPEKAAEARDKQAESVELEDLTAAATASIKEAGYNVEVDTNKLIQKISKYVTEDNLNSLIAGEGPWTVTGKTGRKYRITLDGLVAPVGEIGRNVNYVTTLNGVTLNNWKTFYNEIDSNTGEDYTWLIYGDYLPNSAVDTTQLTGINKSGSYVVYASNNRKQLLDAMNSSYWDSLKTGTLNGKSVTAKSAAGSPTLDLWINSWNEMYPNTSTYTTNQLYKAKRTGMDDDIGWGYYVARSSSVGTNTSVTMIGTEGYISTSNYDSLYFPHTSQWNETNGYWLASPSAERGTCIMRVSFNSNINNEYYRDTTRAFRPVICVQTSALDEN